MVNAQRFRARKVDFKRALPVYRAADLDDLDDDDNRQADQIETGVEKDEEAEHHLQAAISATHAAVTGSAPTKQVYIPTPDASRVVEGYDERYPKTFVCPTSLIRSSETVEECCAPLYCMDEEDAQWLEQHARDMGADAFEQAMDQLESLTRDMVFQRTEDIPTLEYLAAHAADRERTFDTEQCARVFEHWKHRREERGFRTVMASLQQEDTSKTEIDPYVCFRRREVQRGRKTRRADQRSLEQLRRLRINLAMAAQLLEMCLERESAKVALVDEAQSVGRQRCDVMRMRRRVGATGQSWDDMFVPPVQPGASSRKRLARDPTQRARAAAAAAAARKAKATGIPDAALPLPFVLPRSVQVHQYVPPPRLVAMQNRIQSRVQACESKMDSWVDATFGCLPPPAAGAFWTASSTSPALRLRRGRQGRLFVDRRQPQCASALADRQMRFRLGLLRSEDHQKLCHSRTAMQPAIPDSLLRPFSFSAELLKPSQSDPLFDVEPAPAVPLAETSDSQAESSSGAMRSSVSAGTQDDSEPDTPIHHQQHTLKPPSNLPMALSAALSPRVGNDPLPSTAKCN
ncbi:Enhancer of polycomb-like protein 1 [Coemansia sp. RSA 989]|nr:enhancer of polycomb-like-domain-containing protein [Coemansia mojavensis]KAJ1744369.1 Enhancer of polycomb-like protein 1 [Coemansia sp. RSA 1086]KAJ1753600.1 Enhancer of polycomb-like protein 1 [Coemansia sp. RSA 1821]KAJ1868578.1 Enhancer of polycomb-like protein 1 [Coemansia sp. RSA 989]KAJ1876189.1 Enhancer of polycomb-like protein 1 [Coemansia sp. RSA 990]KAJ2633963.1 Enhancer of polycomb-like protein 1 [Coemansia sp. RSA 1290]KAJ2652300.1 Enhancer of polycomb-like protein 1 [Coemans